MGVIPTAAPTSSRSRSFDAMRDNVSLREFEATVKFDDADKVKYDTRELTSALQENRSLVCIDVKWSLPTILLGKRITRASKHLAVACRATALRNQELWQLRARLQTLAKFKEFGMSSLKSRCFRNMVLEFFLPSNCAFLLESAAPRH